MNGKQDLKVEDRIEAVESMLEEYEKSVGVSLIFKPEGDIYHLNLRMDSLRKMSPEECGEFAFSLAQKSLYLQHEINKQTQRINWAKTNIDMMIAGNIDSYGSKYTPYENRKMLAIKDNDYTIKLYEVIVKAQQIIDRLSYIPNKISYMSKTLIELQTTKRNQG
tara:strand:- start:131 stop:622 length:492 start_codon:yes stop_codon:yes gene_type:complete